jgi:hypothetical protein
MRILSASLLGCLILAAAPLQAAAPSADATILAPQEAAQWAAKDLVGIWDITLGEEGPDAFNTEMTLAFDSDVLSGTMSLGSPLEAGDLKWNAESGELSFTLSMGPEYALNISMTRDGAKLVGKLTDGDELAEAISAVRNEAKTKAVAEKAAAIARGEIVEGVEKNDRAPDIAGTDLDGVDFKLSDYKGKVVMLDFWGDW